MGIKESNTRFNITLPISVYIEFDKHCKAKKMSKSKVIVLLITEYLKSVKKG